MINIYCLFSYQSWKIGKKPILLYMNTLHGHLLFIPVSRDFWGIRNSWTEQLYIHLAYT